MPNTMTLISTVTVTTASSYVEVLSIPQTYTDLVINVSARLSNATIASTLLLSPTSWAGRVANISYRRLTGGGTSATSNSVTGVADIAIADAPGANATANTFSNATAIIPNYTGSTQKSISADGVGENNGTEAYAQIVAAICSATSAITGITVWSASGNIVAGSTISVYGILKGSGGATVS